MEHRNFYPFNTPDLDDHLRNDYNSDRRLVIENGSFGFHPDPRVGPLVPARPTDYPSSSSGTLYPIYRPSSAGPVESSFNDRGPLMSRFDQPLPKPFPEPQPWHWTPDPSHPTHRWTHRHYDTPNPPGPRWYPSHPNPTHGAPGPPAWLGPSYGVSGAGAPRERPGPGNPGLVFPRHPRSLSINGGRSGRARFQPYPAVETTASYDQHRDLRLDVDSMSYEELLDLGERIGSVSTGLCEETVAKCLKRTVFSDRGRRLRVGSCVICLERYEEDDQVGTLGCGHDFHSGCVTTWLLMKNACPICKAPALDGRDRSTSPL